MEDQGWHGRERVWLQDVKSWNLLDLENDKRNSVSSQVDQSFCLEIFKNNRPAPVQVYAMEVRNYYSADPTGY